jgi:NCS1 family nucleobase:cation symporter-1
MDVSVRNSVDILPFSLVLVRRVYYLSWILGFVISGSFWMSFNTIWPPPGVGEIDEKDYFGTFGEKDSHDESTVIQTRSMGSDEKLAEA